jgi:hypothetical protein
MGTQGVREVNDGMDESGAQNAIWLALAAVVHDHPDPQRAVRIALNAVEVERGKQLYSTQRLLEWEDGFSAAQESLIQRLSAIAGALPKT